MDIGSFSFPEFLYCCNLLISQQINSDLIPSIGNGWNSVFLILRDLFVINIILIFEISFHLRRTISANPYSGLETSISLMKSWLKHLDMKFPDLLQTFSISNLFTFSIVSEEE